MLRVQADHIRHKSFLCHIQHMFRQIGNIHMFPLEGFDNLEQALHKPDIGVLIFRHKKYLFFLKDCPEYLSEGAVRNRQMHEVVEIEKRLLRANRVNMKNLCFPTHK